MYIMIYILEKKYMTFFEKWNDDEGKKIINDFLHSLFNDTSFLILYCFVHFLCIFCVFVQPFFFCAFFECLFGPCAILVQKQRSQKKKRT